MTTRACWYRLWNAGQPDPWNQGKFHEWGTEMASVGGQYSVGIVEDAWTGAVHTPMPTDVHFGSDPDSP